MAAPPPSFLTPSPPFPSAASAAFSPGVISVVGVLGVVFLLITYYTIVVRYCTSREVFRRRADRDGRQEGTQNETALPMLTRGLEESVIKMIPAFRYSKSDGLVDGTECAVCLSEFEENEDLRLLPKCSHAFHLSCIDNWLQSHSNCPLCRANIVSPVPASTPAQQHSPPLQQPLYGSLDEEAGRSDGAIGHIPEQIVEDRMSAFAVGDGQVMDAVAEGESENNLVNHGEARRILKPEEKPPGSDFDGLHAGSGPLSPTQIGCFSTGFIRSESQENRQKHGDPKLGGGWKRKAEQMNPLSYFRRSYSTGSASRQAAMDELPTRTELMRASTSRMEGAKSSTMGSSNHSATARRWGTAEEELQVGRGGKMFQSLRGSFKIKRSFSSSGTHMLPFIHGSTNGTSSSIRRSRNPSHVLEIGSLVFP